MKKLHTIAEVAELKDVHPQTLRNWEKEGLLNPSRISGNHRIYKKEDLEMIDYILEMRNLGFSLKNIREKVEEEKSNIHSLFQDIGLAPENNVADTFIPDDIEEVEASEEKEEEYQPELDEDGNVIVKSLADIDLSPDVKTGKGRPQFAVKSIDTTKLPPHEEEGSKYTLDELRQMSLDDLLQIAKQEKVSYFRQMQKSEIIISLAYPSHREEVKEAVKKRLEKSSKLSAMSKYNNANRKKLMPQPPIFGVSTQHQVASQTAVDNSFVDETISPDSIPSQKVGPSMNRETMRAFAIMFLELGRQGKSIEDVEAMLSSFYS